MKGAADHTLCLTCTPHPNEYLCQAAFSSPLTSSATPPPQKKDTICPFIKTRNCTQSFCEKLWSWSYVWQTSGFNCLSTDERNSAHYLECRSGWQQAKPWQPPSYPLSLLLLTSSLFQIALQLQLIFLPAGGKGRKNKQPQNVFASFLLKERGRELVDLSVANIEASGHFNSEIIIIKGCQSKG